MCTNFQGEVRWEYEVALTNLQRFHSSLRFSPVNLVHFAFKKPSEMSLDPWYRPLSPPRPPFVRINGQTVEPLILAFPIDIWRLFAPYLEARDLFNMIFIGCPVLSSILLHKGAITSLRIYRVKVPPKSRFLDPSFIGSFIHLTEFIIIAQSHAAFPPDWKISQLPPTLTKLHIDHQKPLLPFVSRSIRKQFAVDSSYHYQNGHGPIMTVLRDNPSLWLRCSKYFPRLLYLAVLGDGHLQFSGAFQPWVDTLPKTLVHLDTPFLNPNYGIEENGTLYHREWQDISMWSALPPTLESISFRHMRNSHSDVTLLEMPSRITKVTLNCELEIGILVSWHWLVELRCEKLISDLYTPMKLTLTHETYSLIPRGLKLLACHTLFCQLPAKLDRHAAARNLPTGLEYLSFTCLPDQDIIEHLPRSLKHLDMPGVSLRNQEMLLFLPAGLTHLRCHFSGFLDVTLLPKGLVSLCGLNDSPFADYWLPKAPATLRWISFKQWTLRGLLLPDSLTAVDPDILKHHLYTHPYVDSKAITQIHIESLLGLPKECRSISILQLDSSVSYDSLPRHLTKLPPAFVIYDLSSELIAQLPRGLTRLTMDKAFRLQSIALLPPQMQFVRPGSIVLIDDDINQALGAITTSQNHQVKPITSIRIPEELLLPRLKLEPDSIVFKHLNGFKGPVHALWERNHFALLPDSITDLSLRCCNVELPWTILERDKLSNHSHSIAEASTAIIKFPSSLTSLTLTNTAADVYVTSNSSKLIYSSSSGAPPTEVLQNPSTLSLCRCSISDLPLALVHLKIQNCVYVHELDDIRRLSSLKTLILYHILERTNSTPTYASSESYISFLAKLPPSLLTLHFFDYPHAPLHLAELPRSLTDLRISSPPHLYDPESLLKLPAGLTRLSINAKNHSIQLREFVPASITALSIRD